jgi:hypothetical protein
MLASTVAWADPADDLFRVDRGLQLTLVGEGAPSVVAGAVLCGFDRYDHALQVAGGLTLAFGLSDLLAGIAGSITSRRDARSWKVRHPVWESTDARDDLLSVSDKKVMVYAVNLGLDAGFAMAGATAIVASQANIADHQRWLGAGVALVVQGALAAIVDGLGTAISRRAHRLAVEARHAY